MQRRLFPSPNKEFGVRFTEPIILLFRDYWFCYHHQHCSRTFRG